MALACSGQRLRTALLMKALASVVVGCASDCTSRWTTRPNPRPSMPSPSHTTFPSRNSSLPEAAAKSLVPKVMALASVTNGPGPAVAMDEDVVASAVLSSLSVLQPAADAVRMLSRTTCFISHRTTTRIVLPPMPRSALRAPASQASLHVVGRSGYGSTAEGPKEGRRSSGTARPLHSPEGG